MPRGDVRAVVKQMIFNETVRAETRHLHKNRNDDFNFNAKKGMHKSIIRISNCYYTEAKSAD